MNRYLFGHSLEMFPDKGWSVSVDEITHILCLTICKISSG